MSKITVTPAEMNQIASNIEEKISDWNQAVTKIYSLKDEMDAMWDGTANDTFNNMFAEDATKYNTLSSIMSDYAAAIRTAANKYIEAEQEVKTIVSTR